MIHTENLSELGHCDAHFSNHLIDPSLPLEKSWLTVQIYLCADGLEGGATTFYGRTNEDRETRIDVVARVGRVLVFQQRGLLHAGEKVSKGMKVTVRTDVMYRKVEVEM